MKNKEVYSFDFASLYPSTMKVLSDEKYNNFWRELAKIKKQELRKKKLEEIQKLNETSL